MYVSWRNTLFRDCVYERKSNDLAGDRLRAVPDEVTQTQRAHMERENVMLLDNHKHSQLNSH